MKRTIVKLQSVRLELYVYTIMIYGFKQFAPNAIFYKSSFTCITGPIILFFKRHFLFTVCPGFFPYLVLPPILRVDDDQELACVSPEARPALNVQMVIDGKRIVTNSSIYSDLNNYFITSVTTSDIRRAWNGKEINCCYQSEYCDRLCRPAETLMVACEFGKTFILPSL